MPRLLFLIFIGYVLYRIFKGLSAAKDLPHDATASEETFRDPVCGVYVARNDAVVGNLEGEKLHFCSRACLERFRDQLENKAQK